MSSSVARMATTRPVSRSGARVGTGGRRATTLEARFTEQIIGLVTVEMKARIKAICSEFGVSQSVAVRNCVVFGIDQAEKQLALDREDGLR